MTWEYEEKAWANGYGSVCGVDEAGRGPVAGPVCAAAVILPAGIVIEGLNDSKKLSEKKREKLFDEITENALAWSVSLVDERVIDEINILQATYRAMKQAVDGLTRPADFVYVDGNRSQGLEQPHECVVSGDAKTVSYTHLDVYKRQERFRTDRRKLGGRGVQHVLAERTEVHAAADAHKRAYGDRAEQRRDRST